MGGIYDLMDTVDLMCSDDCRERFQAEYAQLALRHETLRTYVKRHRAGLSETDLPCPIDILERQIDCMSEYQSILEQRAILEGIDLGI